MQCHLFCLRLATMLHGDVVGWKIGWLHHKIIHMKINDHVINQMPNAIGVPLTGVLTNEDLLCITNIYAGVVSGLTVIRHKSPFGIQSETQVCEYIYPKSGLHITKEQSAVLFLSLSFQEFLCNGRKIKRSSNSNNRRHATN